MNIKRIAKHLLFTQWQVNRAFPSHILIAIEQAINASETGHARVLASCQTLFVWV